MLQGVILEIDDLPEVPYVKDFIRDLKTSGLKLAIVPSPSQKPAPGIFLQAAKELSLSPSDCIVIGDSEEDTLAAIAAGIPCIGFVKQFYGTQRLSRAYALLESFESADAAYLRRTHAHALGYPADILETERLLIRELSMDDFPTLYAMCTAPETSVWMEETLADFETEQAKHRAYLSHVYPFFDLALWGIYEKSSGTLIGRAGFSLPEDGCDTYSFGYLIDTPYRNRGFAKECVPALLTYAKNSGIPTVIAKIKKSNLASLRILAHCGYPYPMADDTNKVLTFRILLTEPN